MANKNQKIWRKNFSIRQVHYQFVTPAVVDMFLYQPHHPEPADNHSLA